MKQTVFTKFAEVSRPLERNWFATVSSPKQPSKVATFFGTRIEAKNHFNKLSGNVSMPRPLN